MIRETVAALLLATIVAAVAVAVIGMSAARGGPICLSQKDARQLWPRIHIWWYRDKQTGDRCWSNRRGRPPRNLKIDPVVNSLAKEAKAKQPEDKCCWPVLPRDNAGNIIEPPPTFTERWQNLLSVFKRWLQ
jgi:hypothetical protein